ncbi:S8 family serine peptidase [Deinococcus radiotolerans]|uniref:Serine protease n=1 Tax=Deinococcus radiotolerans TaxID=1309407 RepID=A0ABQ2FIF8_9DEIO|nr:S8 family serine peptidase [Deinococcus radiotolerans]GGL00816.1 serine protease [Deinococcus radiotolerans]
MRRSLTCATLTISLLSACSMTVTPTATVAHPDTLLTVPVTAGTSDATLAQQYGGTVEYRTATFAVLSGAHATPLAAASRRVEKNEQSVAIPQGATHSSGDKIWATGITTWASGDKIWATSLYNFGQQTGNGWNGPLFTLFPQNSQEFVNLGVPQAQLSPNYQGSPVIAVIDGPMDTAHPALADSMVNPADWFDFASNDAQPTTEPVTESSGAYGHATGVAGVALQIAPKSRIMPVQVLAPDGTGYLLDLVKGILWAVDHGADVINLSVGTDLDSPSLRAALEYAQRKGVDVAAAAGNSGSEDLDYPAAYLSTTGAGVAVASVNAQSQPSAFTSTSDTDLLFAPGESIRSLYPDGREASWTGTSFSTPMAAAALAMLRGQPGTQAARVNDLFTLGQTLDSAHPTWKKLNLFHLLD